eukprot:TRINITY_DN90376_c0_g1_i1.p1 TRINITY_DN90376_c0_g1~~TRINITY_DN90376_c0_g1_i1.p1  ORF type:complete len:358 (-),score=1.52 TRINITY_DN90376_c0_g1_i1:118-1191(-)
MTRTTRRAMARWPLLLLAACSAAPVPEEPLRVQVDDRGELAVASTSISTPTASTPIVSTDIFIWNGGRVIPFITGGPPIPPTIPGPVQRALEKHNVEVNYTYYYDIKSQRAGYTTEQMLEDNRRWVAKLIATGKPQSFLDVISSVLPGGLLTCLVAYFYKKYVVAVRRPLPPGNDMPVVASVVEAPHAFHLDYCSPCGDCKSDCHLCCFTCWCPAVRIADTFAMLGHFSFWTLVAGYVAIDFVSTLIDFLSPSETSMKLQVKSTLIALAFSPLRIRLRQRFGAPEPTASRIFWDACQWFACPCNAAVQEAYQVDLSQNVRYSCPCDLVVRSHQGVSEVQMTSRECEPLVGAPVHIDG